MSLIHSRTYDDIGRYALFTIFLLSIFTVLFAGKEVLADTSIPVFSPDDDGIYDPGSLMSITWGTDFIGTVSIEIWKNDAYFGKVVSGTVDDGHYDWTVPTDYPPGKIYKIRVVCDLDDSLADSSESNFELTSLIPPIANAGGPYHSEEGWLVSLDASGSYDPDGSIILFEWDLDYDGVYDLSSITPTALYTWHDDYEDSIRLRVTDDDGLQSEVTTSAEIDNVVPIVDIDSVDTPYSVIFVGDEIVFHGSSFDPGTDTHTVEWDFGDTSTATGTLDPAYVYTYSATFTVVLTVTDDDGGVGTAIIEIRVETTSEAIDDLVQIIEEMNLQNGIENSLDSKLDNAQDALDAANSGDRQDAINKLIAFINAVNAQRGNKLTEEEADYLIAKAQEIIDHI